MVRGLYEAAGAMAVGIARGEIISNNLSNASTAGFKRTIESVVAEQQRNGARLRVHGATDPSQGALERTGNPADLALEGPGALTVHGSGESEVRSASVRIDPKGILATSDGKVLVGEHGDIKPGGAQWRVDEQGRVWVAGQVADRLKIAGGSPAVRQGYREASNVNPVQEMVNMIGALRAFEAAQQAVRAQDETLARLVNDVART